MSAGHDVPPRYRELALRAVTSRAGAVKLFCLECVGYHVADVRNCTAPKCPLYAHRPFQTGDEDADTPQISGVSASPALQTGPEGIQTPPEADASAGSHQDATP